MNSLIVAIKNKNDLVKKLESFHHISYYKKPTFVNKLFFVTADKIDIYFYQPPFDKEAKELASISKKIIVNSFRQKDILVKKDPVLEDKIVVVYPYIDTDFEIDKGFKKEFKKLYKIEKKTKIISFCAKDLTKGGIDSFISILSQLENKNFVAVVESSKEQIEKFKLKLNLKKINFRIILLEDFTNKYEFFSLSDIFLYPSSLKNFNTNILKAMLCKNGVFVSEDNFASEIVDTFAKINNSDEVSTIFKINALLTHTKELKKIKKENYQESLKYSFQNSVATINSILG